MENVKGEEQNYSILHFSIQELQRGAFVHCYMIRFVAFDLVLRIVGTGVMRVAFILKIPLMNLGDRS